MQDMMTNSVTLTDKFSSCHRQWPKNLKYDMVRNRERLIDLDKGKKWLLNDSWR